jgi:hypothetical protein
MVLCRGIESDRGLPRRVRRGSLASRKAVGNEIPQTKEWGVREECAKVVDQRAYAERIQAIQ